MSNENWNVVKIESLGVNDQTATVIEWFFSDNEKVKNGDLLAVVETTKTAFDILSNKDGYLIILKHEQSSVTVGEPVAVIVNEKKKVDLIKSQFEQPSEDSRKPCLRMTKKAAALVAQFDIGTQALENIGKNIIREKDIENLIKNNDSIENYDTDISLIGKINESFLAQIEMDDSFRLLPSAKKIEMYRENGAIIEDGVEFGDNSIILSNHITLRKQTVIGADSFIKAFNFKMGIMSVIGRNANIITRHVKIGDVFFSGNSITIGGGGAYSDRAKLVVGDECLVSSGCFLNTGEGIIIGNRVGLSPNVKLYTHSHWQSELDGYTSNFGPIIVHDNVYITGDCLIVPNVTIGKGATIFGNSTVVNDVEPYTQLSGNPALVVNRVERNISQEKKIRVIRKIISSMYKEKQIENINRENVIYVDRVTKTFSSGASVLITLNVSDDYKLPAGKTLFNLQTFEITGTQNSLSDEVRNYFRKRGVRFKPIHWRYMGDEGLWND